MTHPAGNALIKAPQTDVTGVTLEAQQSTTRVKELESEVTDLEACVNSVRNLAVIGMGLALAFGGFCGLLLGIVGDVAVAEEPGQMSANTPPAKNLSRRQFFKLSAATVGASALAGPCPAWRRIGGSSADHAAAHAGDADRYQPVRRLRQLPALVQSRPTTCIRPPSNRKALSSQTYTFVQRFDLEGGKTRFVKRQCMHCLDAACASACPVSALHKTAEGRSPTASTAAWAAAIAW